MKISLFIPVWKRFKYLNLIISAWRGQVDDITVWDDSGETRSYPEDITVIKASKHQGSHIKFRVAQILQNDMVLISDDDIIPMNNFVAGILKSFKKIPLDNEHKVVTVFGRKLSKNGYESCPLQRGDRISRIHAVDWGGGLLFGHRKNFTIDVSKCPDPIMDDLFWSFELRKQRPETKIFSVPTIDWKFTIEANDKYALCKTPGYWLMRDNFVKMNYDKYFGEQRK